MTIIYKAFDDEEFDTKGACETYEKNLREKLDNIGLEFYDCAGEFMSILPKSLLECSFIHVKTLEALDILTKFGDSIETVTPEECGLWYWDGTEWVSLEEDLRPWMNIYEVVCKAMAELKES